MVTIRRGLSELGSFPLKTVFINEPDLVHLELFRFALSEENPELRERAITNAKHDVIAARLDLLFNYTTKQDLSGPDNIDFMHWAAISSGQRSEAAYGFSETSKRYEAKNEKKLNIAEALGSQVFHSVKDGEFRGMHTSGGIFEQIRAMAKKDGIHGAKDKNVLSDLWQRYRGVVHLGMAITYLEDNPDQRFCVLELAELFRSTLSKNCPKGTSKPYVRPDEQISFVYLSSIWGPRYGNQGLSYGVD